MTFPTLLSFLSSLENSGELKRVTAPVDKDEELACIARLALHSSTCNNPPALLFENIKGHHIPVVVGLYESRKRYATALKCNPEQILDHWAGAIASPLPVREDADGAVKKNIFKGTEASLLNIPIPVWTPGRDAGPYIPSASVITSDPETGIQNMAVYRIQIQSATEFTVGFGSSNQHGAIHFDKWKKLGQKMPVALVIGGPPVVQFAAPAKTAYGVDELTIAGALQNESIPVVKCETVPLLVPAEADIVIEGYLDLNQTMEEGPFGEALGYMCEIGRAPRAVMTAICMRDKPVFHGYIQQVPPSEGHLIWEMGILGPLLHYLKTRLRLSVIKDMAVLPGSAGVSSLIIQVAESDPLEIRRLFSVISKIHFGQKLIAIVDEDIDIHDPVAVIFALTTRCNLQKDLQIDQSGQVYQPDPSVYAMTAGLPGPPPYPFPVAVLDARVKCKIPPLSLPPGEKMEKVRRRWNEFGLAPLKDRDRISKLLYRDN